MTENSPTYQSCQENKDCDFASSGQICSEEQNCIFECKEDSDCIFNGKCLSNICYWSGEPVPPPLGPPSSNNSTQPIYVAAAEGPPSASGQATTDNGILKFGSPLVVGIIIITTLVVVCGITAAVFFFCRRKRLAQSSRGLKPLTLTGGSRSSTSLKRSKKDQHREKESRSSKKAYDYDDGMYGEPETKDDDDFEQSYSKDAVGSGAVLNTPHVPRLPVRSQTMYGSSTPSTVELNVDYPVLQQSHHFMASEGEYDNNDNNYQQQQQQ